MKVTSNLARVTLGVVLLLLLTITMFSQSTSSRQSTVLLEIIFQYVYLGDLASETTRVYADGHYLREEVSIEQAKSSRQRKVLSKVEKQLEPEEIAELISWVEQSDFLNSQPEYAVTIVRDHPDWFIINFRNRNTEKSVKVINFSRGNEAQRAKVPPSVLKLLKWADPYYFELAQQKGG
ncbi:MAG TPA: hypothetical protein VF735_11250 [Pyrinomonadaceae bacterium]|jgi:hypothetical protein